MLSRFSGVLQTAADVLAPPATRLEDFEYHWKMILNFYQNYDDSSKVHIEDTRIPHHLHQMLQLIVDEEKEHQGGTVGPCLEAVVQRSICLLDALQALAASDRPPGARALALAVATALLRRTTRPCVNSVHVYRPLQRMLIQCNESPASPTEKEEVELLLTLCGWVRKEPGLANIFTTPFVEDRNNTGLPEDIKKLIPIRPKVQTPKKNPLFEVDMMPNPITLKNVSIVRTKDDGRTNSSSSVADEKDSGRSQKTLYEDNEKFLLIDLLLSYLNSADNQVVLRACEGIMIVSSLGEDDIANLVTSCSPVCETIVDKLAAKYRCVPPDVDPNDVDHLNITWAYVAQDFGDKGYNKFHGYRELTSFFSWLDYCDTLMKECHPTIAAHLARTFRANFLEGVAEAALLGAEEQDPRLHGKPSTPGRAALAAAMLAKCLRVMDSADLINEFSNWLVGDGEMSEWPLLLALINNCLTEDYDLTLETLRFFETIIEKGTEHSIQRLVLSRVCGRGYFCVQPSAADERDRLNDLPLWRERERNREAMKQLQHEDQVNEQIHDILTHEGVDTREQEGGENIHRVINSFLLLLPRAVLSDPVGADYEHYIHDAQRHYQLWLDITSTFNWPADHTIDNTASSTHSYDSRPEADIHLDDVFDPVHTQPKTKETESNTKIPHKYDNISQLGPLYVDVALANSSKENTIKLNRYLPNQNIDSKNRCCDKEESHSTDCVFSQRLVIRSRDLSSNCEEEFDEGPFFRMLFKLLGNMPNQPYQVNLHLTSIISKLALMPHPNLHEYLLHPSLPTAKKTQTLFKTLQEVAKKLTMEIPRLKNYKKVIETTRLQLMSEDPSYDESGDHNQLVESLIVLEEFCKELAAIAFVKYQHSVHMQR
ncbi:FHF complex subunit HOOK interacting protein 2A-like isoform X2 [Epargyreus clarus]|uniref:FHF complex subunit HOOK interacting protein 2A-like isoform X1 n=1 Tax=Epargyreus clarus TaxID=520877 RepID=UPI003C2BD58E